MNTKALKLLPFAVAIALLAAIVGQIDSASASGRIADATTIEEIQSASDYKEAEHGEILRLYRAVFNREPDVKGAIYWIHTVYEEGGKSILEITEFIATDDQPEFKAAYADVTTNPDFVDRVYVNMLGRIAEAKGRAYWIGQMDNGLSRANTVRWVALSDEFIAKYPYNDLSDDGDPPDPGTSIPD